MDTKRDDEFLRDRIKAGKEGAMPAFGEMFNEADITAAEEIAALEEPYVPHPVVGFV